MVTLYDPHGNKIDRGRLKEEQSAPSLRSVRQVFSGYPSNGLTPYRLGNIFRMADQGDPHAQCELFEEMEEKDLHLTSVMSTRKRAITGLEITVEAPDNANAREKKAAELVQAHMENIESMPEKLIDILDAIGKGYSASEIIWGIYQQEAIIEDIIWREPKWFRFDQESMSELRLLDVASPYGTPLTPYKYITHTHKAKSGIAVRGGILRPCAWMYLFKNYDMKDWAVFAEVYAQPLRVGKYPTSASEQEKDVLLQAVANMGTDAAAIIPDSMMLELVEAQGKTGSADLYEKLARFCDEQVSKGVLGQTSSADAMAGGLGSGQAVLHGDVRHDLLKSDARQLSATLNRDMVRPLVDLNMGPVDRYPKICIIVEEPEDLKELADNTKTLHDIGLPIPKPWLYKKFNIPEPAQGEAVLQIPPNPPLTRGGKGGFASASNSQLSIPNSQLKSSPFPSDLIAERLVANSNPAIGEWMATIETMLANAQDLPQFREMLINAFADLSPDKLAGILTEGEIAAQAAGRFDIENEAQ